ncbi:MAG: hypothetical protein WCE68_00315 [Anaerolineales bacterium]
MKTIWGIFSKIILIAILAALITPPAYLAWRAGQPMELPQFKGLTYYQYMAWQKIALRQQAVQYHAMYPNAKMGGGLDMCYNTDAGINLSLRLPLSGLYALAGIYPAIKPHLNQEDVQDGTVPSDVTWLTFLPVWWTTFEKTVWYRAEHGSSEFVAYCRLQPNIPTPVQFEEMQTQAMNVQEAH